MSGTQRPTPRKRPAQWRVCARKKVEIPQHLDAHEIDLGGEVGVVHLSRQAWAQLQYMAREWLNMPEQDEIIFENGVPKVVTSLSGFARGRAGAGSPKVGGVVRQDHVAQE